jgi:dTDP-4-amino-4,6-dideoxygalactose transaminase
MTFAATANAIAYTGAEPYFIDCDRRTGNMDPELLEQTLKRLRSAGEHVAAILPVDLLGKAVDYTTLSALAEKFGIRFLADAAESLGASHRHRSVGSFGDASVFSFNGNKVMTTSGGGMVTTSDGKLAARIRYLATQARQPAAHYEHTEIGYNYRLSNLLAALGRAQLTRLDAMISRRRAIRERYREYFARLDGVSIFGGDNDDEDNAWLTSILVDPSIAGWNVLQLAEHLERANIESRPLWKPMHLQPVFRDARATVNGSSSGLFERGLTLPSGSVLTDGDIDRVLESISGFMRQHRL